MRLTVLPFSVALCAALAIGAWAAAPQTSKTSTTKKKVSTAKPAPKAVTAKSTAKAPAKTPSKAVRRTPGRPPVVAHHYAPQQPSQERFKEIQQALAAKGYFNTEPDGNWGPASIDALKRFQHDQNLAEDGKIGSLSLIALGLGPKREAATEVEIKNP